MRKIVKKLELKRETVRKLVMRTGLKAGLFIPSRGEFSQKSVCDPDTHSVPGGMSGDQDGTGGSDAGKMLPTAGARPGVFAGDLP